MTIAISMGDPSGIGPEIAIKAWHYFAKSNDLDIDFAIVGAIAPFIEAADRLGLNGIIEPIESIGAAKSQFANKLPILDICELKEKTIIGSPNPNNAKGIIKSIEAATDLVLKNHASSLVTLPIAKNILYAAGFSFGGHTEFIADLCKDRQFDAPRGPVMMLAIDGLKVALVTIHEALSKVPNLLTIDLVLKIARATNSALERDFSIKEPKIALLGLNPHAGESGTMGKEELEIINPAAALLRQEGIDCSDALPADSAFNPDNRAKYDCFIAMYHDQGLIPIKTLDYWGGVNVTLGLPIIRTSPDHGTGFNIAREYNANPQSLINAIKLAHELAQNRAKNNG